MPRSKSARGGEGSREEQPRGPGAEGSGEPAEGAEPAPAADESAAARAVEEELQGEEAVADRLMAELEELRDRHLRLAAEFENYRKRTRQELLKTQELGQADLVGRLVDSLDDLRRITELSGDATTVEALHEGVALVERKLLKELGEAGLEPIEAEGERFDPNVHEALATVPTDDPEEDDRVSTVFVRGYRFGDRLIRPARVEVKKYRSEPGPDDREEAAGGEAFPEGSEADHR